MTKGRAIRCYDYVNHPYERVRDAFAGDTLARFQDATRAASSRAESVAAQLRVNIAGVEVAKDIAIEVRSIEEHARGPDGSPSMRLSLQWEAADTPRLFPFMQAELSVYPLTSTETQLDFAGHYEAPLGALGTAMNAIVGHRIAEASVHRFLNDVARHLRETA
jgi:hypothetical protein